MSARESKATLISCYQHVIFVFWQEEWLLTRLKGVWNKLKEEKKNQNSFVLILKNIKTHFYQFKRHTILNVCTVINNEWNDVLHIFKQFKGWTRWRRSHMENIIARFIHYSKFIQIRIQLKERISFVCTHVCNEVHKVLQLIPLACSSKPGDCFLSELQGMCLWCI